MKGSWKRKSVVKTALELPSLTGKASREKGKGEAKICAGREGNFFLVPAQVACILLRVVGLQDSSRGDPSPGDGSHGWVVKSKQRIQVKFCSASTNPGGPGK